MACEADLRAGLADLPPRTPLVRPQKMRGKRALFYMCTHGSLLCSRQRRQRGCPTLFCDAREPLGGGGGAQALRPTGTETRPRARRAQRTAHRVGVLTRGAVSGFCAGRRRRPQCAKREGGKTPARPQKEVPTIAKIPETAHPALSVSRRSDGRVERSLDA